jgi:DNA-binding beta-propeller fold protein YncE
MRRFCLVLALAFAISAGSGLAQDAPAAGPYKVLKTAKVGGDGGFDYVYADVAGRRLYIPRGGAGGRVTVFNLDTLEPAGEIPNASGHGAAVDPKSNHGFVSSKPVVMWDTKTLETVKSIDVQGGPDGILFDPFNERVYIWSHGAPNATVINAADGSIAGTIDVGGAPEQAVTDGKGHIYVDVENQANVAAIDAKTMTVTAHYSLGDKGGTPAGLAFDVKNRVLFVACRTPAPGVMVMMSADDGKILGTVPLAGGSDGAVFNPATMEAFSSAGNATLTVIKENSPTSFAVEQIVQTMSGAKTLTFDSKTEHVLLIGAETAPPVAPAPATPPSATPSPAGGRGGRGGRGQMVPGSFSIVVVGK